MENIEHIFYINLDKREDRRKEIEIELKRMELDAERFSGIYYPPPKGIVGCTKSHLSVILLAKERKYKNVLILEDDLVFLKTRKELDEKISILFKKKADFDVCFLAYHLHKGEVDKENPFLIKAEYAATASAYIINEHYYDKLIDLYVDCIPKLDQTMEHWNYANDQAWKVLQEKDNWYCFTDRLGRQRDGFSDNANKQLTYQKGTDWIEKWEDGKSPGFQPGKNISETKSHVMSVDKINEAKEEIKEREEKPLILAVEHGHIPIVKYLIENEGDDINQKDYRGMTPLSMSCKVGNLELVKYFLEKGAII